MTLRGSSEMTAEGRCFASNNNNIIVEDAKRCHCPCCEEFVSKLLS